MDKNYWNQRYLDDNIPWDAGNVTTPLSDFIDQLTDKQTNILIPGAGRAHEAAYLHQKGFDNVYVCDWAEAALEAFQVANPDFPENQLICEDFFKLDLEVDLIIEQTFFCALPPKLRPDYANKTHQLLKPEGVLAGLLFAENFEKEGPPFGGTAEEYETYFKSLFDILEMELADNSIKPRAGKELFVKLQKR